METAIQLLIVVVLLVMLAEVTYLVTKLPKQVAFKKQSRPVFVDTSVLIDGRIIPVAKSGFMTDTLVIPRSVVGELQFLADNADHEKRARARHGLDIVTELQALAEVEVELLQDGSKADEGVDERLLNLAKKYNGAICTIDYNLNKVAAVEGIKVLNINELAQTLRMAYLPGEKIVLELVQKGQDSHQGVGYLSDGTMVVVENASKLIGSTVEIEFIRSLQTAAGKMMFARLGGSSASESSKNQKPAGKKPIAAKQPQQPQQVVSQPSAPPSPPRSSSPSVFHSDNKEQYKTARTRNQNRPRPNNNRQAGQSKPTNAAASKKPARSSDREAALLDLVDKQ